MEYRIITNEIWGNNRDGFKVNDCRDTGRTISIVKSDSDTDIIRKLKTNGTINKACRFSSFIIEGETDYGLSITYNTSKLSLYPILELRPIIEGE